MVVNNNLGVLNDNIQMVQEDNWSIVDKKTDIWDGELPYKTGMQFPTKEIKDRAAISKTNKLIYNNDIEEIASSVLSVFPEIDPMYGWQIREIIAKLPYFKNSTNAWVGLVAGNAPAVDINDDESDEKIDQLLESSNFASVMQSEVRSRFTDVISAYRVDTTLNGKPTIISIDSKNLIVFVNKEFINSIEVNVIWGTYKDKDEQEYIDFVEYHYDGYIKKSTFKYNDGIIGELVNEEEDHAFDGKFNVSPVVVFKHNVMNDNEVYGTDQYRYWSASILAGMREFQNVLRLGERTREMLRKVPENAIQKNPLDGSSSFINKGTISYTENGEGNSPDIEYAVPEIRMNEAIEALDKAIAQIGLDTQLGTAFFCLDKLGSRLSADSVRAALLPARLEAKRITTEMAGSVRELIIKLGMLAGLNIEENKMNITFYDGFPRDEIEDIKSVQLRLESNSPSISLEDAIMKLEHVSLRVAKQKAAEIRARKKIENSEEKSNGLNPEQKSEIESEFLNNENDEKENIIENSDKQSDDELLTSEVKPSSGVNNKDTDTVESEQVDDTVWQNQFLTQPRDIPQGQ